MLCVKCGASLPDGASFCHMCGKKQALQKKKNLRRANGTGTVYRLAGRRKRPWVAAKNKIIIGYYATKTDALEALGRLSSFPLTERYNLTFADVYSQWSEEHFSEIGPSGVETYENAYRIFSSLHNTKFRSLRKKDFQMVIDQHLAKSHSSLSKYKQLITQMSDWAIREEIITTSFAKFVKLPENTKKEKEIFSPSDIKKLEKDKSESARIVLMLLSTGMRIGELFSLPLSNYHESYVIGGSKTEAGRNRIIPIRPEGREHFSYFAESATGPLLLSGYSGQRLPDNFRKRDYYPLLEKLHIKRKTPHATRHTYTSRAIKEGLAPEVLQEILGHADYSTTVNIYNHFDPDTLVQAVNVAAVTNALLTNQN